MHESLWIVTNAICVSTQIANDILVKKIHVLVIEILKKKINDELTIVSMEFLANLFGSKTQIRNKLLKNYLH